MFKMPFQKRNGGAARVSMPRDAPSESDVKYAVKVESGGQVNIAAGGVLNIGVSGGGAAA